MSHFVTFVVVKAEDADDIETAVKKAMAPYQENNMGDCPTEYLEFNDVYDEVAAEYASESEDVLSKYPDFESYITKYHGYEFDKTHNTYGYWYNPNSKWDWYVIGGRWKGYLFNKQGEKTNVAMKGNIDFEARKRSVVQESKALYKKYHEVAACYADVSCDAASRAFIDADIYIGWAYQHKDFQVPESVFAREDLPACNFCTPFAILIDGQWYEKGEMGWWGVVSNKKDTWDADFEKVLNTISDDDYIVVVDCHI